MNQCEVSASSGPNVAELPANPISTPCASANQMSDGAAAAAK